MGSEARRRTARISDPFKFDRALLADEPQGAGRRIAGTDEAGRGCLAGPVVAAAVVFDYSHDSFNGLKRLTDSKLLTAANRETLYVEIMRVAKRVSWAACSAETIDRVGLHKCNMAVLTRALEMLDNEYELAIVDAFDLKRPDLRSRGMISADYKSAVVGAASVVAKVVRDRLMHKLDAIHPEYGFADHVGYATEQHRDALREHGPCRLHRLSFQGVSNSQLELWEN